jgi:hypothetical protein
MAARQAFSHESLGETSTTTNGSWPVATTFSFTPDANSDYWLLFSCLFTGSATAGHSGQVSVYHDQGATSVGYWEARAQEASAPQDWFSVFCVHKSAFGASPGQQDYAVLINSSHAGDATKIKDIRFLAIKADAADKYAAVDASSTGTAGAGYATKTTLTFTPALSGDYLLIASATMASAGASNTGTRLNHSGGSIYGEHLIYHKAAYNYHSWATAAKINLAASSQTFNLQFSPSATVDADIEAARILALRLDKFENGYVAQDFSGGNSTADTDQDYLTLTQTPQAVSHAILAVAAFRTQSTSVSGYLNVCKGGTNYTETPREGVNAAGWCFAGAAVKETLAASSTTWKWRARAETAGTAIHTDDLLIAVLQLDVGSTTVTATASFAAAVQKAIAATAGGDAAVQKTLTATAAADSAVQKALSALASADSAVQKAIVALTGGDAAVLKAITATAGGDAAVQLLRTVLASADSAVQTTLSLGGSFDAVVAVLRSAQAGLDAAVRKAISAGFGAGAAVQQAFMASASIDLAVQAVRVASANADVAVQIARSAGVGANVYVTAAGVAEVLASLDVAVQALREAGAAFDVAVQASRSVATTADVAVLASLGQTVGAGAVVLATITAGVAASAAVAREYVATFSADAAVSRLRTCGAGLDVMVGSAVLSRPIINLAGVYESAVVLAGSHAPTASMRGVRAAMVQLLGRTARKP